jgi:DNA repair protein RadC
MIATPSNRARADGELPREKFAAAGRAGALTSEDLLAILLKTGAPGCDVFTLAHRLIAAFGGTGHLVRAELATLKRQIEVYNEQHPEAKILGIGEAKRMELAAAFELVRREYARRDDDERALDVTKAENRYRIFRRALRPDDRQENFCVLVLDAKLHPLTDPFVVFRGTLDQTTVHPREVFQEAVRWGAYAVMVAHNHPSGDPQPGAADLELTRRLVEASKIMAIPLLDHLVLGAVDSADGRGYVSMRESGLVRFK